MSRDTALLVVGAMLACSVLCIAEQAEQGDMWQVVIFEEGSSEAVCVLDRWEDEQPCVK